MKGLLALAVGSLSLSLLVSTADARMCRNPRTGVLHECNPKPPIPRAKDLSAYNPSFHTTKTGRQGATATIIFQDRKRMEAHIFHRQKNAHMEG
jgi:hypothetical protein